jgi:hypothetical protein
MRRIMALCVFGVITSAVASVHVILYGRQRLLPLRKSYAAPCEQDTADFCSSSQSIFSTSALVRGAGGVTLVAGVTLGALALLRLTSRRWLLASFTTVALLSGTGGLRLSQQALETYHMRSQDA